MKGSHELQLVGSWEIYELMLLDNRLWMGMNQTLEGKVVK